MKTFKPQVSVKLIKSIKRAEVVPGLKVAARYGDLVAIDLTPYLGERGSVSTSKSVRELAGGFNVTFYDKPESKSLDTIQALVEPMDLIEIRFCREPGLYKAGEGPPVVMRGLVSDVTRTEASGENPNRTITIAGQDFGKILQILQIYYLNNSVVGDNIVHEFAFFQKYASTGDAKIKSANDFLRETVSNIINPYLKKLVALADGSSVGAKVINAWTVDASIDGAVTPWAVASFNNVSIGAMLASLFDVGPFNELFVEDRVDGVTIVLRPNPYYTADGKLIQGTAPEVVNITDLGIITMSLTRTDAGVANYYWVGSSRLPFMSNEDAQFAAQVGDSSTFIMFEYMNAEASRFGFRKMEVETVLVDPSYGNIEGQKQDDVKQDTAHLTSWMEKRRKVLSDSNKDNVVFESGTIQMAGDERVKAGRQLVMRRAKGKPVTAYITKVQHNYQPFTGFTTTLAVERVTSFIERAQAEQPQYRPEVNLKGVR